MGEVERQDVGGIIIIIIIIILIIDQLLPSFPILIMVDMIQHPWYTSLILIIMVYYLPLT